MVIRKQPPTEATRDREDRERADDEHDGALDAMLARRQFLRLGAGSVGAAATLAGGACAPWRRMGAAAHRPLPLRNETSLRAYIERMDRSLAAIEEVSVLGNTLPSDDPVDDAWQRGVVAEEAMATRALRSLYLTGAVNDLHPDNQKHPEIQRRLRLQLPEIDRSVFETAGFLRATSPAERREVQTRLRSSPETTERIAQRFDRLGKAVSLPRVRRLQMRQMIGQASWQLRKQPVDTVLDGYVDKVSATATRHGQFPELERYFAARIGERAFWRHQRQLATATTGPTIAMRRPPGASSATAPPALQPEPRAKKPEPGQHLVTAGAVMLGLTGALAAVGVGLVFTSAWIGGAILLTVGGLTLIIGLIVLLVGVDRRRRHREARQADQ